MKKRTLNLLTGAALVSLFGYALAEAKGPEEAGYLIKATKVGGVFEGATEIWTTPKTRQVVGELKNGKPTGIWTFWDSRGAKIASLGYADDVQSGPVEMWYGSFAYPADIGKPKLRGSLKNGRWDGDVVTFFPSGQKRTERSYQDGVLVKSVSYETNGAQLPDAQARAQAAHEDQADATYLAALDKTIRNSVRYAKAVP